MRSRSQIVKPGALFVFFLGIKWAHDTVKKIDHEFMGIFGPEILAFFGSVLNEKRLKKGNFSKLANNSKSGKHIKQMSHPPFWGDVGMKKWSPFLDSGARSPIFGPLKVGIPVRRKIPKIQFFRKITFRKVFGIFLLTGKSD